MFLSLVQKHSGIYYALYDWKRKRCSILYVPSTYRGFGKHFNMFENVLDLVAQIGHVWMRAVQDFYTDFFIKFYVITVFVACSFILFIWLEYEVIAKV